MEKIVSDKALRIVQAMQSADTDNLGIQANKLYEVCGLNTRVIRAILAHLVKDGLITSKREKRHEHVHYFFTEQGLKTKFNVKTPQNMTQLSYTLLSFIELNGAVGVEDIRKEFGLTIETIKGQLNLLIKRNHIEQIGENLYEPKYE